MMSIFLLCLLGCHPTNPVYGWPVIGLREGESISKTGIIVSGAYGKDSLTLEDKEIIRTYFTEQLFVNIAPNYDLRLGINTDQLCADLRHHILSSDTGSYMPFNISFELGGSISTLTNDLHLGGGVSWGNRISRVRPYIAYRYNVGEYSFWDESLTPHDYSIAQYKLNSWFVGAEISVFARDRNITIEYFNIDSHTKSQDSVYRMGQGLNILWGFSY